MTSAALASYLEDEGWRVTDEAGDRVAAWRSLAHHPGQYLVILRQTAHGMLWDAVLYHVPTPSDRRPHSRCYAMAEWTDVGLWLGGVLSRPFSANNGIASAK